MQYHAYEFIHAMIAPARWAAKSSKIWAKSSLNPLHEFPAIKNFAAGLDVFESVTRRYGKPDFCLDSTQIDGREVTIEEEIIATKPFCNLLHFARDEAGLSGRDDPKVLLVAPMSGHYATLLRGTVEAMLPEHDVYITDWMDSRDVPLLEGSFDLDDFVDYIIEFVHELGPNLHIIAVCQPAVPVLAAAAVMASRNDPMQPASLTLMGGPIDTRRNPTMVNNLAKERSLAWFESNVISYVPWPNLGWMRKVYPGFVQLTGFMTMNLERHQEAHVELFNNLVKDDDDSVAAHRKFYDEYLAVMDLPAEFYLQTVKVVFQEHDLPDGRLTHRGELIDCRQIVDTALLTVEGEKDDICGLGQTEAAHDLCPNIPADQHYHYVQSKVGHYGVFNGRRWRNEIQPRIRDMIRSVHAKRSRGDSSKLDALPFRWQPGDDAAMTKPKSNRKGQKPKTKKQTQVIS